MKIIEKIAINLKAWGSIRNYLLLANILLVVFLIGFSNLGFLPIENMGDFYFIFFIVLILALYRPGWAFLLFIGVIGLENINLAPENLGIAVRPYQLLGGATLLAVGVRYFSKRLNFDLFKPKMIDWLVIVFVLAGFISSIGAEDKYIALKHSIIIASFVALYFLVRIFIQSIDDLKKILPFFLSSFLTTALYGIWQNWQFLHSGNHFEIMPGRPNATFAEADWLGMYAVLVLTALYAIIFNFQLFHSRRISLGLTIYNDKIKKTPSLFLLPISYFLLITCYLILILTVSRSAWLGAGAVSVLYVLLYIWHFHKKQKVKIFLNIGWLVVSLLFALSLAKFIPLTNFELGNRLQSTGGQQEITVACNASNCWHINLEDIEKEKKAGNIIKKTYRDDPNVNIRAEIYQKSWAEIKNHPILGIGWGNIGNILGTDERGAGLNSSNIFLEIYLGAGLLGLVSFVILLSWILWQGINNFFRKNQALEGAFLILSFFAIVIPNLFNAGIMLGFIWAWLGVAMMKIEK